MSEKVKKKEWLAKAMMGAALAYAGKDMIRGGGGGPNPDPAVNVDAGAEAVVNPKPIVPIVQSKPFPSAGNSHVDDMRGPTVAKVEAIKRQAIEDDLASRRAPEPLPDIPVTKHLFPGVPKTASEKAQAAVTAKDVKTLLGVGDTTSEGIKRAAEESGTVGDMSEATVQRLLRQHNASDPLGVLGGVNAGAPAREMTVDEFYEAVKRKEIENNRRWLDLSRSRP